MTLSVATHSVRCPEQFLRIRRRVVCQALCRPRAGLLDPRTTCPTPCTTRPAMFFFHVPHQNFHVLCVGRVPRSFFFSPPQLIQFTCISSLLCSSSTSGAMPLLSPRPGHKMSGSGGSGHGEWRRAAGLPDGCKRTGSQVGP